MTQLFKILLKNLKNYIQKCWIVIKKILKLFKLWWFVKFTLKPFSIQQEILGMPKIFALQPLKYISLDDIDTNIKPIPGKVI